MMARESTPRADRQAESEKGQDMEARQTEGAGNGTAKKVYIDINAAFVKRREDKEGNEFFSITLPRGTTVDGVDRGGWSFTQSRLFPSQFRDGFMVASFPNGDWKLRLSHSVKDEDGKWESETVEVTAGAVAAGMKAAAEDWKQKKAKANVKAVLPSAGPRTIEEILEASYPESAFGEGEEARAAAAAYRAEIGRAHV